MSTPALKKDELVWYPIVKQRDAMNVIEGRQYIVLYEIIRNGEMVKYMRVCKWWSDSAGFSLSGAERGIAYAEITMPI
jgi:hypothetical protein